MSRFSHAIKIAAVAAAIACAGFPASAQVRLDIPALDAEFERLLAALPSTPPEHLRELAATVPGSWTVEHAGQTFNVPTDWITRGLDQGQRAPAAWPTHRDALSARIKAFQRELTSLLTGTPPLDIERSRQAASAVLARKEFQGHDSDNVIARLLRRVAEWLTSVWDRLGGNRVDTRKATSILAWVVAGAALIALSWWLVASLRRTSDRGGLSLSAPAARRRSARAWARQAAATEDPRELVRCAYRAAVVSLEEEGAWRHDEARTPREHVRLLPAAHARRTPFADVARRFEDVWFAAKAPTTDDTQALLSRLKELGCLPAD